MQNCVVRSTSYALQDGDLMNLQSGRLVRASRPDAMEIALEARK